MNRRDLEKAIEQEVAEWPDVSVEFVAGGKHPKAKFTYKGTILSYSYSGTPSDGNSVLITLGQVRRTLRRLEAVRSKPEPSREEEEKQYHKPNAGAASRGPVVAGEKASPRRTVAEQLVDQGVKVSEQEHITDDATAVAAAIAKLDKPPALDFGEDEPEDEGGADRVRAAAASIVDGVYFGLPDAVYHAVPRLSSSGLQNLAISPATFWAKSWLNPEKDDLDEEATAAQILGKAYHCARLEPHTFHDRYCRKPDKDEFGKELITSDAGIKAALKDIGEPQTCGATETIADRARRLVDAGVEVPIWALIVEEFEAGRNDRIPIAGRYFDQIVTDMERIAASGEIHNLLSGGFSEVSIFWTDRHGLKMKARLDYLTLTHWDDLKTFDNSRGVALDQAIANFVRYNRLYIQAATYRDAVEAVRVGGLDVVGDATDEQRKFIATLRTSASPLRCFYVFTEKGGVPNLLAREFEFHGVSAYRETEIEALVEEERRDEVREALGSATMIYSRALWEIDRAKRDFVLYSEVYEAGRPWFPIEAVGRLSDLDFNQYWLEGKA